MFVKVSCCTVCLILNVILRVFSEGMCVDWRAPIVITVSGRTIHPLFLTS